VSDNNWQAALARAHCAELVLAEQEVAWLGIETAHRTLPTVAEAAVERWLAGLLDAGAPEILALDAAAAQVLGRTYATRALRIFLASSPGPGRQRPGRRFGDRRDRHLAVRRGDDQQCERFPHDPASLRVAGAAQYLRPGSCRGFNSQRRRRPRTRPVPLPPGPPATRPPAPFRRDRNRRALPRTVPP
jgi:hypothetical protein